MKRRTFLGVTAGAALAQSKSMKIGDFFNSITDEWMRMNPDTATYYRYFTGDEQDALDRKIAPLTLAEAKKRIAFARKGLADLKKFDRAGFTQVEKLAAETLEWQLQTIVDEEAFLDFSFPLDQMNGWNVASVDSMTVGRPVTTVRDAENYVVALGQVALRMNEATARAKSLAKMGLLPPKFILQETIHQLESFTDAAPAQNPFVTALVTKLESVKEASPEIRRQAEAAVAKQIYPAWKRAAAELKSQLPKATDDAGIWRLKGGDKAYEYYLRRYTTTDMTAEQVHEIGLKRVAEIEAQMDALFRELGRNTGSAKERIEKLAADLEYPNPTSEASREKIIADLDAIVRDAEKRCETLFDLRPKAPLKVQAVPTFAENDMAANYNPPAQDGSRPGIIQYPRRPNQMTKFGMRTLAYHEGVPGHHFQLALQSENKELPRFLQLSAFGFISASGEGWALYSESLAAESGWYEGDPEGRLGQLSDELLRARRLVVDTGIHTKKWTRQQAIDYGVEPSEIDRYIVWPGQACSYMVGQLKIIELREKARAAMGGKFSVREFHNIVLGAGSVPLQVLEGEVDGWIAREASK
ncbi:MAG: DUF885 domain-containing protein [Bryobacteraceae bacterium]